MASFTEGEEWTVVKSKRPQHQVIPQKKSKVKKDNAVIRQESLTFGYQQTKKQAIKEKTTKDYIQDIDKCLSKFKSSAYFSLIRENLHIDERLNDLQEIVMLGIGSIENSLNSLWQLVWILAVYEYIIESIPGKDSQQESCKLSVFDPMLQPIDHEICAHYHITVSSDNHKGFSSHVFTANTTTIQILYYMPHCPYRLYCNILWSAWDNLMNIGILGNRYSFFSLFLLNTNIYIHILSNSFISYEVRRQIVEEEEIERLTDSVTLLTPYITEVSLWSIADSKLTNAWEYKHQWESAFCDLT
jgi:hypothetical protein